MNKSENITNLVAATIKVMESVKGIEKSMTIGTGNNAYKGIADKDVKKIVGEAMTKNGLAIFPTDIEETVQIDRWEQQGYMKQQVFSRVKTTYLLIHTSGEYIEIMGSGHGVDSQDKAAGKSTTYALKYALLYTFLIPTGDIDDADKEHSDHKAVPATQPTIPVSPPTPPAPTTEKKQSIKLIHNSENYKGCVSAMSVGVNGHVFTLDDIKKKYVIDQITEECLIADVAKTPII